MKPNKQLFIIAGANGSGKSALAAELLIKNKDLIFINADDIAKELNPLNIDLVKVQAGKKAINKIYETIAQKQSFMWESTISGNFAETIIKLAKKNEYSVSLIYIFVDNPQICIDRVKTRSLKGGHIMPQEDILRRYYRSRKNFLRYINIVDYWELFYNGISESILTANKKQIINKVLYDRFMESI